jgi:Flp pilus assembly pilin Flp
MFLLLRMALGASGVLSYLRARLYSFYKVERGQDLIEYAVIAGGIGLIAATALLFAPIPDAMTTFANRITSCITFDLGNCG